MIDTRFLLIFEFIVDDTEVYMGQELSSNISYLFMFLMVLDRFFIELMILLGQFLVVDPNAVISQSLSMDISNALTHLEELLVEANRLLKLSQIIIQDSGRVISSALISTLPSSFAGKGENRIVLQSLPSLNTVVRVGVAHIKS